MSDKKSLFKKMMIGIAIVVFLIVEIIGLCWGKVIEETLFAEVAKWLVMGVGLGVLVSGILYALVGTIASRKGDGRKP